MRRLVPWNLWIGHAYEERDSTTLHENEIEAIVLLAAEVAPAAMPRDLIILRVPLVDGSGDPPERLILAVRSVASLIDAGVPTLVVCDGGMSRSPAIVASGLALARGGTPSERLAEVARLGHCDVTPGLWRELLSLSF